MAGYPVLYSFRRCPYAMRARMALYVSGQSCELREVVLRDKPPEMIKLSPKATVPVLQLADGEVVDQSLDIMLWALRQHDPQTWLKPEFGALDDMLAMIREADGDFKAHLDRYKYAPRYEDVDPKYHRAKGEEFLRKLETRLTDSAQLFGAKPALADYAIAPFIRQFAHTDRTWFDAAPYSHLQKWLANFLATQPFTAVMTKYPAWMPGDPPTLFGP